MDWEGVMRSFRCVSVAAIALVGLFATGCSNWIQLADFLDPRTGTGIEGASASLIGGKIYVSHGFRGGDSLLLSIYDIATDTWTHGGPEAPDAAIPRSELAGGTAFGKHYAIGGRNSGVLSDVEEFDPAGPGWTTKTSMNVARAGLGAASLDNKIYAIGGRDGGGPATGTFLTANEVYDPLTNMWTPLAPLPLAVSDIYATIGYRGKVYVFGGFDTNTSVTSAVQIYDVASNSWSAGAPMPTARAAAMVGICNGQIYVFGGAIFAEGGGLFNTAITEIYDPASNTWSTALPMLVGASEIAAGVTYNEDKIYAIGSGILGVNDDIVQALPCPKRGSTEQKGSLLVFSKVEVKWDADGTLIQDTFLDLSNDADRDGVDIQAYFVNGDLPIAEETDDSGNVIREFEPGWNTADCRFRLTKRQPHFWSAARGGVNPEGSGCQPFTVLDDNGRPDPETGGRTRILRGFVVMWAVGFVELPTEELPPDLPPDIFGFPGVWTEIRWNHLKGDGLIVNYAEGSAWEYSAWAAQARNPSNQELPFPIPGTNEPGVLLLDGLEYDLLPSELLLDFYASGSTALSRGGVTVSVDTELTLHPMTLDLRQDGVGPVLTKAEIEIFNENESKFSGTRRCICCWDSTLLSQYVRTEAIPNHFLRTVLRTDKGSARIDGVASSECDYRETCGVERTTEMIEIQNNHGLDDGVPLLGLASKRVAFSGAQSKVDVAGMNLPGLGLQTGVIVYDAPVGSGELRSPDRGQRSDPLRASQVQPKGPAASTAGK